MSYAVVQGDCRQVLTDSPENMVSACVTDPPYELGFMGKSWDSSGVAFDSETWRAVLRVLKPGGHLLAFGGTRTYHRIACALEDAGFEIRDCLSWLYGTGFPKSLNLGDGRGTALKPAWEPIIMARKPLVGTVAGNVLAHGTGALNIDGCRRPMGEGETLSTPQSDPTQRKGVVGEHLFGADTDVVRFQAAQAASIERTKTLGRWPANLVLDEEAAALVGEAARFFYTAKTSASEREAGLDALPRRSAGELTERQEESDGLRSPRAGAGRSSQGRANHHPTVKPISLMRWLVRLVTPPGGLVLDPFCGSGSTGCAAVLEGFPFLGIELTEEYVPIAEARILHWAGKAA